MFSSSFRYRLLFLCALVMVLSLSGCGYFNLFTKAKPDYAEEAANVYVSAYPAVPWCDIREKLEPKNNLSMEDARKLAAQTTQTEVAQFLTTFAIGLGIGLPVRADASSQGYGAVPTAPTTPETTTAITAKFPESPTFGIDGSTLLTAGTALYQQAQILDNQISNSVEPEGYRANLITLQVNVQPKQRNVSYDAYMDVSLLPGRWDEAFKCSSNERERVGDMPCVIVYPLIITDAMETTSISRTIEAIRQAALQLAGTVGSVGVFGGAGGGTAKTEGVVGLDKNSLVTVGRVTDHTVRVRLGAMNSGSAGLALVPRTYNVSLVVLSRWEKTDSEKRVVSLQAITHTSLVSTEDGKDLKSSRNRPELARKVAEKGITYKYWEKDNTPIDEVCLDLLQAIDYGEYTHINKILNDPLNGPPETKAEREIRLQRFLAELIEIQIDARYSKFLIKLPELKEPKLPDPQQLALYSDDKKAATSFVLLGGKQLSHKYLEAWLSVQNMPEKPEDGELLVTPAASTKPSKTPKAAQGLASPAASKPTEPSQEARDVSVKKLIATSISITGGGSKIEISFPSLTQAKLEPATSTLTPLTVKYIVNNRGERAKYAVKASLEEDPVKNPVTSSSAVLVVDQSNVARVTLQVGKYPDSFKKMKIVTPLLLKVDGADVRSSTITNKGVPLKAESVVTLDLGNLTPAKLVTLTTIDSKDKTIGTPITLTVERLTIKEK